MRRGLDLEKAKAAFKRAAEKAMHGTREERSGRVMPPVQSSMMTSVRYDEDARELDITFASGKTYRYLNVPLQIYVDLLEAASKGEFFNDNIKDAFAFAEVRRAKR